MPDTDSQATIHGGTWIEAEQCRPTDIDRLFGEIDRLAPERNLKAVTLGQAGEFPILLLEASRPVAAASVLVAAGFHGEEPAGCWGIVRFLQTAPAWLFERVNISFLPLVNPTGFRLGKRRNDWDENANQGFCPSSLLPEPSREGVILLNHLVRLKALAKDGFLSLHEDVQMDKFFLYTFEPSDAPGPFSQILYQAESQFFEQQPDGMVEDSMVKDGLVFRHCDGTFEDLLFHEGIPRTACTETPGRLDINLRITANTAIITAFVEYAYDHGEGKIVPL
jgi:hypothetical protein